MSEKMKCDCVYGVTKNGREVSAGLLYDIGEPRIKFEDGRIGYGLFKDYFVKRNKLMTFYKHCPYCGEKLNFSRIKKCAKSCDDSYNAVNKC